MRILSPLLALAVVLVASFDRLAEELPTAIPNPNITPGGELRDGVLRIRLDAKLAMWHPEGDSLPGIPIEAFAEPGQSPRVPGPLIRVPLGTEIRSEIRNSLERDSITFRFQLGEAIDSVVIAPGMTRELAVRPSRTGTFFYGATTSTPLGRALRFGGMLAGAVSVDSVATVAPLRDRIFVIQVAADAVIANTTIPLPERSVWAINGRSWPHTERFSVTVGDTLRWRLINVTADQHPMHLHGFYFTVDATEMPASARQGPSVTGRRVVTERMPQSSTMSMTWVPERAGNWLFHCHFQEHIVPHGAFGVATAAGDTQRIAPWPKHDPGVHHDNHAYTGMGGLVVGIEVSARPGQRVAQPLRGRRRLRLVAVEDAGFPDSLPSLRFVLEDPGAPGRPVDAGPGAAASPTLNLTLGESVSITVVNRMREATAVHWHGIELESYFDGVPGFSGTGRERAPLILPADSFEARFTPPRTGTFMYHSHVDELRQHRAGLVGALIVRDPTATYATEEHILLIKSARGGPNFPNPVEINGRTNPDTLVMSVGRRYRLRFIAIQRGFPNATVSLTARPDSSRQNVADTSIVHWRAVAKDGAELPEQARTPRLAQQTMGMGETFDYEFTPERSGHLRIEVRNPRGLLARVPIRVE